MVVVQSTLLFAAVVRCAGGQSGWLCGDDRPSLIRMDSGTCISTNGDIVVERLDFSYAAGRPLFCGLSVTLPSSGFHGVFGESGVGKSTLARILCRLQDGWNASKMTLPSQILYCYNRERFPGWMTVESHLKEVAERDSSESLWELFYEFRLSDDLLGRRPHELSSGQLNRLNVLRYLAQEFGFLVMDESLNNVDERTRQAVLATIKRKFPERGFVYISHQISDLAAFSQKVIFLKTAQTGVTARVVDALNLGNYSSADFGGLAERFKKFYSDVEDF